MMRGDILGELSIKILEPDRELGNCLMRFLVNGVDLPKQFTLRYLAIKEF